jgi:PadR family transcriptional regulator PadR
MPPINETEQYVLLALARLGDDAYGVTIRREITRRSGAEVSIAAVYAALSRLEERRLTEAWLSDPVSKRGGRARKHFRLTPEGVEALTASRRAMDRMWEGLDLGSEGPAR